MGRSVTGGAIVSDAIEVSLGGKTYRFSKIRLNDLRKFENWIRSERLRITLDAVGDSINAEQRAKMVSEVLGSPVDVTEELASMGGVGYLLWLSVAREQPDLKFDDFAGNLQIEDMRVLQTLLDKLAFGGATAKEDGDRPPADSSSQVGEQSQ